MSHRIAFAAAVIAVMFTCADADASQFLRRLFNRPTPPRIIETVEPPKTVAPIELPKAVAPQDTPKKEPLPTRAGFVTIADEGRFWIFREGSKDLAAFKKIGEPEKSVTRINVQPYFVTLKAPDIATLEEFLSAKAGFVTKFDDGRLWVFRQGSKEYDFLLKHGELEKHIIRVGAGPRGMTLKAPDAETMDGYLKAPAK